MIKLTDLNHWRPEIQSTVKHPLSLSLFLFIYFYFLAPLGGVNDEVLIGIIEDLTN